MHITEIEKRKTEKYYSNKVKDNKLEDKDFKNNISREK